MFFKKNRDKTKKLKAHYVKICPRCGSLNIKIDNQGGSAGTYFGLPTMYRCQNCGYNNYTFPEINLNELKMKKEEQKSKND